MIASGSSDLRLCQQQCFDLGPTPYRYELRRASGALLYEAASLLPPNSSLRASAEKFGEALDVVPTDPPYVAHRWGESRGAYSEASAINALRRLQHIGVQATNGGPQGVDLILIAHVVDLLRPGGFLLICPVNVTMSKDRVDGAALTHLGVRDRLRRWWERSPHCKDRQINEGLLGLLELAQSTAELRERGLPISWLGLKFRYRPDEDSSLIDASPVVADTLGCCVLDRQIYERPFDKIMGGSIRRALRLEVREAFNTSFLLGFRKILMPNASIFDPCAGSGSLIASHTLTPESAVTLTGPH